jgi:hypothetical protein
VDSIGGYDLTFLMFVMLNSSGRVDEQTSRRVGVFFYEFTIRFLAIELAYVLFFTHRKPEGTIHYE